MLSFIKMASVFSIYQSFYLISTLGCTAVTLRRLGGSTRGFRSPATSLARLTMGENKWQLEGDGKRAFLLPHPLGRKLNFSLAVRFPPPWPHSYCQRIQRRAFAVPGARAGWWRGESPLGCGDSLVNSLLFLEEMSYNGTGISAVRLHRSRHNNAPRQR